MNSRHIPKDKWCEALETFSRQHEGWIVNVAVSSGDGQSRTEARNLPLQGVSCDAPGSNRIAVIAGGDVDKHLTHEITRVVAVAIDETDGGVDRGLRIRAADGSETCVEFRAPMRPDEVDGVPKR